MISQAGFQFLQGTVQTRVNFNDFGALSNFNSSKVRYKLSIVAPSSSIFFYFNSSKVRYKPGHVSDALRWSKNFNSSKVRYKLELVRRSGQVENIFQFLQGTVQTRNSGCGMEYSTSISIPPRYGTNLGVTCVTS